MVWCFRYTLRLKICLRVRVDTNVVIIVVTEVINVSPFRFILIIELEIADVEGVVVVKMVVVEEEDVARCGSGADFDVILHS